MSHHVCRSSVRLSILCIPAELTVLIRDLVETNRFEYHWQDGIHYKKPTKLSAPGAFSLFSLFDPSLDDSRRSLNILSRYTDYVDCLMNWVQGMLDDESIFPSKMGSFPFTSSLAASESEFHAARAMIYRCTISKDVSSDD